MYKVEKFESVLQPWNRITVFRPENDDILITSCIRELYFRLVLETPHELFPVQIGDSKDQPETGVPPCTIKSKKNYVKTVWTKFCNN